MGHGAANVFPASDGPVVFATAQGPYRVDSVAVAATAWRRALGLMGRRSMGRGRGLFLAPCPSVHTCFMRFDLDLIFVSRDWRVVRIVPSVAPWRMAWGGPGAWAVLELQAGWFPCERLAPGIPMRWEQA